MTLMEQQIRDVLTDAERAAALEVIDTYAALDAWMSNQKRIDERRRDVEEQIAAVRRQRAEAARREMDERIAATYRYATFGVWTLAGCVAVLSALVLILRAWVGR